MALTMSSANPSSDFAVRLRGAGLRPTRQRVALARVLFESGHRHVTAEGLHAEVKATKIPDVLDVQAKLTDVRGEYLASQDAT